MRFNSVVLVLLLTTALTGDECFQVGERIDENHFGLIYLLYFLVQILVSNFSNSKMIAIHPYYVTLTFLSHFPYLLFH